MPLPGIPVSESAPSLKQESKVLSGSENNSFKQKPQKVAAMPMNRKRYLMGTIAFQA